MNKYHVKLIVTLAMELEDGDDAPPIAARGAIETYAPWVDAASVHVDVDVVEETQEAAPIVWRER